ncbi:hypothetical protein [Vibrio sp. 10N.222.54.A3]|uniref:hypothetical protein n=1 Tax=Vibrio sp. 10N.222.54.A3 TaxID=3229633 RepID=UPI0035539F35
MKFKEKLIDWYNESGVEIKKKIKNQLASRYSSMLFDNYYDRTYKNQEVSAAIICLTKKRFWLIVASLIPTFFMTSDSLSTPVVGLYISLNAAGIFYIVFNLYPEVKQSFRAAKQALFSLEMIKVRRAWLMKELTGASYFTEANRYLTEDSHIELVNKLRELNGFKVIPVPNKGDGQLYSIVYSLSHPLAIGIKNGFSFSRKPVKTLLDVCNIFVEQNLRDLEKLKAIPNIDLLGIYDSLNYLEAEMSQYADKPQQMVTESDLVAYFIQAVDKVNYSAQIEMPFYVGQRYDLKFEPSDIEKGFAKKLVTKFYELT